jgi:hypothetical protein
MKKAILILLISIIANTLFAQKAPDLIIKDILEPEDVDSSKITVIVKNMGNSMSKPVKLKLWDVDIDINEAKKIGVKEEDMWIFVENTERAKDGSPDYDRDFEIIRTIPALKKREEFTIIVYVSHWVYDSNCEIGAYIDCDEELNEKDESNNKAYFFEGG